MRFTVAQLRVVCTRHRVGGGQQSLVVEPRWPGNGATRYRAIRHIAFAGTTDDPCIESGPRCGTFRFLPPAAAFKHTAYSHIAVAFLLWGLIAWGYLRLRKEREMSHRVRRFDPVTDWRLLVGFVTLQIALGLATWVELWLASVCTVNAWSAGYVVKSKAFTESLITTAHVATGSLILGTAAMLWFRARRVAATTQQNSPLNRKSSGDRSTGNFKVYSFNERRCDLSRSAILDPSACWAFAGHAVSTRGCACRGSCGACW